jgi:hypothetical protein
MKTCMLGSDWVRNHQATFVTMVNKVTFVTMVPGELLATKTTLTSLGPFANVKGQNRIFSNLFQLGTG